LSTELITLIDVLLSTVFLFYYLCIDCTHLTPHPSQIIIFTVFLQYILCLTYTTGSLWPIKLA